jgi:hypothetical protein
MIQHARSYVLATGVALAAPMAVAQADTIAELAPRDSIAMISVDDYPALRAAFDETGFADLLKDPAIKAWISELADDPKEAVEDALADIGLELRDIPEPQGAIGGAIWLDPVAASPLIAHVMVTADFGDDADRFDDVIAAILEDAEDNDEIHVLVDEIEGADVREIEFLDLRDEFEQEVLSMAESLFIAQRDGMFYFTTDEQQLVSALRRAEGEAIDAAQDRDEFVESLEFIESTHIYLTVFAEPLFDAISRAMQSDDGVDAAGGVAFDFIPILDALGLSSIRALAYGMELDAPNAMAEFRASLITHHLEGLLALFDQPLQTFEPPAFVTADATEVRMLGFDYSGVVALVNEVIGALPQEAQFQAQAMAGFLTAAAGPILQTLGPDTTYAEYIETPLRADSMKMLLALRAGDPLAITNGVEQMAGMAGLESRVFQGDTIWSSPFGPSITITGGNLIIGPVETVESAMRQVVNADAARLSETPRFKEAASFTSPGAVYYSWMDFGAALEFTVWNLENWDEAMRSELEELGFADEEIDQWIEDEREFRGGDDFPPPPVDVIRRHLGDLVGETHIDEKGVHFRGGWLTPN